MSIVVVVVDVVLCYAVPDVPCFYFGNYDVIGALNDIAASTRPINILYV